MYKLNSPYIQYNLILSTDNFDTSIKLVKCLQSLGTENILFPPYWKQIVLPDDNIKLADGDGIVSCRWRIGNKMDLYMLFTITDGRDASVPLNLMCAHLTINGGGISSESSYHCCKL